MKIIPLIFTFIILLTQQAFSNYVQVSNVRLTGQNTTDDFTMVEFDISWENSWRYSGGPGNWDAVWIFVKYRIEEFVYIPQGSFSVGSGRPEEDAFYTYLSTTTLFNITSEGAITVGPTTGSLYYSNLSFSGDHSGLIPSFQNQYNYY